MLPCNRKRRDEYDKEGEMRVKVWSWRSLLWQNRKVKARNKVSTLR